jgi:hypothetical protein
MTPCAGKQTYAGRALAQRVARSMDGRGKHVRAYLCTDCGEWHVGRPYGQTVVSRPRPVAKKGMRP